MDALIWTLSSLSLSDILPIIEKDREIYEAFKRYVLSGYYFADTVGGLDVTLLPDLEAALLPFDSFNGYPKVYYLISEAYDKSLLYDLPIQVHEMRDILHRVSRGNLLPTSLSPELQENKDIILTMVSRNINTFPHIHNKLRDDKDIIMAVLERNAYMIQDVSPLVPKYREFAIYAVTRNSLTFSYISPELQNDKEIALIAVTQNGYTLQYVSNRLKDDGDVVTAAVTTIRWAIEYASPRLQALIDPRYTKLSRR